MVSTCSVSLHRLLIGNCALAGRRNLLCHSSGAKPICSVTVCKFSTSSITMAEKVITPDNMNPQVIKMEYAVRGPLVIRATQIEKELKAVRLNRKSL